MARKKQPINSLHSKFYTTISHSSRFRAEDEPKKGGYEHMSLNEEVGARQAEIAQAMSKDPEGTILRAATDSARARRGADRIGYPDRPFERSRSSVSSGDMALSDRAARQHSWRHARNIYRAGPKDKKSVPRFAREEMSAPHREWFDKATKDPTSDFNAGLDLNREKTGQFTSGQRERQLTYVSALQEGASHEEAMQRLRTRLLRTNVGRPTTSRTARTSRLMSDAKEAIGPAQPSGRSVGKGTKYQSLAPRAGEFTFGITASAPPRMDALKRRFPTKTERDLVKIQQAGTELISQELLANQKWAHETRRANLLGKVSHRIKENPDKVTIFTTNIGHPAVSVPSDSLVGQYIIKKRKSVLGGYGTPSSQLKGEFPQAVRDQHIVDVSMGTSYGVQGRQGLFSNTGYRVGRKNSPGYGRPKPLGAQILYDSAGRPLYDAQGNIRYSEGATRPVDWTTPNVGFRILIG